MKLEDLDDDDGPDMEPAAPTSDEIREAQEFLQDLEDLVESDRCEYARDTLEGIYETVQRTSRVTPGQRRAVENIEGGARGRR